MKIYDSVPLRQETVLYICVQKFALTIFDMNFKQIFLSLLVFLLCIFSYVVVLFFYTSSYYLPSNNIFGLNQMRRFWIVQSFPAILIIYSSVFIPKLRPHIYPTAWYADGGPKMLPKN